MYSFLKKHRFINDLNELEDFELPQNAVMFKESSNVNTFILKMLFYGKNAFAKIYLSPINGVLVCYSSKPLKKKQFIIMSLAPTIIFAIISYLSWALYFVNYGGIGRALLSYCIFPFIFGVGDYSNVFKTIRQVPNGALVINSGMHTYWFKKIP